MANYAVWNVRKRHESLTKPLKGKRLKKRARARIGLEDALARKSESSEDASAEAAAS